MSTKLSSWNKLETDSDCHSITARGCFESYFGRRTAESTTLEFYFVLSLSLSLSPRLPLSFSRSGLTLKSILNLPRRIFVEYASLRHRATLLVKMFALRTNSVESLFGETKTERERETRLVLKSRPSSGLRAYVRGSRCVSLNVIEVDLTLQIPNEFTEVF